MPLGVVEKLRGPDCSINNSRLSTIAALLPSGVLLRFESIHKIIVIKNDIGVYGFVSRVLG